MPVKTRVVSDKVERYTIWDNLERHVQELTALGATEADLQPLRSTAAEVDTLEQQEALEAGRNPELNGRDLADLTEPRVCANGWTIQPPTAIARRYAVAAVLRVTGGGAPTDGFSLAPVIAVGLWVLRHWGDGRKDAVMRTIYGSGQMAEALPGIMDEVGIDERFEELSEDYLALMGGGRLQKKTQAQARYREILSAMQKKFSGALTPAS